MPEHTFLPTTREEMQARGWDRADIILVTGDAYIDHPSFGAALIGRWLEHHGYRVAILSQPHHQTPEDFMTFGRPRLFFGITAGNLDSIVANYTGNAKVRDRDDFSPGGDPYFPGEKSKKNRRRPDRATIVYANLARAAYHDVPIVLGGIEASLRRFIHYDYQQKKLRDSMLADAKADILVYGMGERAVLDIADRITNGENLNDIAGTCRRLTDREMTEAENQDAITLPSWEDIQQDVKKFMTAETAIDKQARSLCQTTIRQRQKSAWILQNPPAEPLTSQELDELYGLPFAYAPHPATPDVPAFRMIRDSITIVRGCYGNCSFCAITRHQGPVITSRGKDSILTEVRRLAANPKFKGTISDLGGPTANLYATSCSLAKCQRRDCLYPNICKNLKIDQKALLELLRAATAVTGVKNVFISSGLRMELLLKTPELLKEILRQHTPGALKIAPEHTEPEVLALMHKQHPEILPNFVRECRNLGDRHGISIKLTPYFISAHPGCTLQHMRDMADKITKLGLEVRQFQDFTPAPGTLATAMYVTGLARDTMTPIYVARGDNDRRAQRESIEKIRSIGNYKRKPKKHKG